MIGWLQMKRDFFHRYHSFVNKKNTPLLCQGDPSISMEQVLLTVLLQSLNNSPNIKIKK